MTDISVIVLASTERHLLHGTLLSVGRAVETARDSGLTVSLLIACQDADTKTLSWLRQHSPYPVAQVAASCRGEARNLAIARTNGRSVAIIDGGDIWSRNFLAEAATKARNARQEAVWRPAYSVGFPDDYFESADYSVRLIPDSANLARSTILHDNPYPSTFFARRETVLAHPFPAEDIERGWNDVDGWWTANLLGHDIEQKPVADTLHYFRSTMAGARLRQRGPARFGPTALELGRARIAAESALAERQTRFRSPPASGTQAAHPVPVPDLLPGHADAEQAQAAEALPGE